MPAGNNIVRQQQLIYPLAGHIHPSAGSINPEVFISNNRLRLTFLYIEMPYQLNINHWHDINLRKMLGFQKRVTLGTVHPAGQSHLPETIPVKVDGHVGQVHVDDLKSITISSPAAFIFASSQVLNCVTFIFLFDKESLMVFTTDLKIGYCINFFKLFI